MTCKCDMRTKLVGDGCSECNPELYKEMLMDDKPTYDELAIAVQGYEEECKALKAQLAYWREQKAELGVYIKHLEWHTDNLCVTCRHFGKPCDTTEEGITTTSCSSYEKIRATQSLNHITEQLGCSEQALNELKAQIAERQCSELAAQVEEETIERCSVESWSHFMKACTHRKVSHGDYDDFCSAGSVRNTMRKYSNQPETMAKDGE